MPRMWPTLYGPSTASSVNNHLYTSTIIKALSGSGRKALKPDLYEVWGDTVKGRHLLCAIVIGAVVSLGAFFTAQSLMLQWVESAQMARAYAMLIGILGCLAGGAISATLFKPQRIVMESKADAAWQEQVLANLEAEFGDLGRLSDLPRATIDELREMGLLEMFEKYEQRNRSVPDQAGTTRPAPVNTEVGAKI